MRLLRFVAVACMVTVGVASLGCGGGEAEKPAEETPAAATTDSTSSTEPAKDATASTTPVSLAISGMA